MRVGFITTGLDVGGAEVALLRLLPAMQDWNIQSTVVSLRTAGIIGPRLEQAGVPVFALGLPRLTSVAQAWPRLTSYLSEISPAMLHGWMYHGNLAALAAAWRLGVPLTWGIRQSLGFGTRDKWLTRRVISAGGRFSTRANLIIYNSAVARTEHESRGYDASRAVVVPNGFDTKLLRPDDVLRVAIRAELGIGEGSPVVAQVARYHPAKDYSTLLRAAARVIDANPEARFVLIGAGLEWSNAALVTLIRELGLVEHVRLLGRRDDVPKLLCAVDIVTLTSAGMEGFPNSLGEAMCCAVPCVGTAVGDVPELIGDTGVIVPPSDPAAVAVALKKLLALDPAVRRALGERARQRIIERFSLAEVARRYAQLLHSVVERH